jgi:ATP-binding cassette subfamily C (CFTR/MRP) protein 1
MDDLSDLRKEEEPSYSASKFRNIFYSFPKRKKGKLLSSFKRYLGFNFCLAGILFTIASLLQFSGPLVIGKILNFLSNPNPDINEGLVYVSILVGCYLIRVFILQHSMKYMNLSCVQVLNSANFLIYKKILNLSSAARKYLEAGTITNNINVDLMSFYLFIWTSTYLFSGPVMISVAVALLIYEVGWIGAAAPVLFLFGMLMQQKLMTMGFVVRKDQLFWSDKRSKCVN